MMLSSMGGFIISYMNCVLLTFLLFLLLVSSDGEKKMKILKSEEGNLSQILIVNARGVGEEKLIFQVIRF